MARRRGRSDSTASIHALLRAGRSFVKTIVFVALTLQSGVSQAQITLDGTVRPGAPSGPLPGPNVTITDAMGNLQGNNLFHSFSQFSVPTNGRATFTGPASVANIISRVTGGQRSLIDGTIDSRTAMPNANFFLLNPSGVLFGANAVLNVGGFHVTTAGCVRAAGTSCLGADDVTGKLKFFADTSRASVLTADTPVAFGFVGPTPVRISVEGGRLNYDGGATGRTVSIIAGDAPFPGTTETGLKIAGPVRAGASSTVGTPGGRIQIVGVSSSGEAIFAPDLDVTSFASLGRIDISGRAVISATRTDAVGGSGTVLIRAGRLTVDGSSQVVSNTRNVTGLQTGVDIRVTDETLLANGSVVGTQTTGTGRGGDVVVTTGTLTLTGGAVIRNDSLVGGPGGQTTVTASTSVNISGRDLAGNPSEIRTQAQGTGAGGRLSISAPSLTLSDTGSVASRTLRNVPGGGRGGDIVVEVERLSVTGGARIRSVSRTGDGGNITVRATETAALSGVSSGITQGNLQAVGGGRVGDISLDVGTLTVSDSAQIQSGSLFDVSQGGNVTVAAREQISISTGGGVSSQSFDKDAGRVTLSGPALTVNNGFVNTSVQGSGRAGEIAITVGTLSLTRGAQVVSSSQKQSTGAGGNITVRAGDMQLTDHAAVSATSEGTGPAGNIALILGESLRIQDSAITTAAKLADGGNISITTTGSLLYMLRGHITTSVGSGAGAGGNITIGSIGHPVEFVILNGSEIRADAFGGPGGNIDIFAGTYLTSTSILSASSALGVPGTIGVQAGITDVSGSVGQLPESVLQAATLLRAACAARLAGGQSSSLVVSGREGLPAEPGGVLPSPLVADGPDSPLSLDEQPGPGEPSIRTALWIPAPRCLR